MSSEPMKNASASPSGWTRFAWPTLEVVGPDAASWLHGMVTSNVLQVSPSSGSWGLLLSKQGKIQAEVLIAGQSERLLMAVTGGDAAAVLETLDGYLVMEDAEITPVEGVSWVVLLTEMDTVGGAPDVLADVPLPWRPKAGRLICQASPASGTGSGWGPQLDESAWLDARLRLGIPAFGVDFDSGDNPHAAGIERLTVDWKKGCYLGQEVVCMQDMRGKVRRRLVRIEQDGTLGDSLAAEVFAGDERVGQITSHAANYSFAKVEAPHYEAGTSLRIVAGPAEVSGVVVPLADGLQ